MRQIILDTETTGLDPKQGHRVIEIGALEMINRKITDRSFHVYLNPEREIEEGALAVHGISNQFLADKPLFSSVSEDFFEFISGAELVIHNAPFDLAFINHEFKLCRPKFQKIEKHCTVVDTLVLARKMHPGQKNNLDALCKRYHVDHSKRDFHGALLDAELLARVYLLMTGGQGSLFQEVETAAVREVAKAASLGRQRHLIVKKASVEEETAHQKFLSQLRQTQMQAFWEEV